MPSIVDSFEGSPLLSFYLRWSPLHQNRRRSAYSYYVHCASFTLGVKVGPTFDEKAATCNSCLFLVIIDKAVNINTTINPTSNLSQYPKSLHGC